MQPGTRTNSYHWRIGSTAWLWEDAYPKFECSTSLSSPLGSRKWNGESWSSSTSEKGTENPWGSATQVETSLCFSSGCGSHHWTPACGGERFNRGTHPHFDEKLNEALFTSFPLLGFSVSSNHDHKLCQVHDYQDHCHCYLTGVVIVISS